MLDLALLQLTDSAAPTGSFSHSLGFETAVAEGRIVDEASFGRWIDDFLATQLTFADAAIVFEVYRIDGPEDLVAVDELATTTTLAEEVRAGTMTMGRRLLEIAAENYPGPWVSAYSAAVSAGSAAGHSSVAFGALCRQRGVERSDAARAHLYSTVSALTQNAVRAVPLGQNAGQRVVARAREGIDRAVAVAATIPREAIGATPPGLDIDQMLHASQRARMFMS